MNDLNICIRCKNFREKQSNDVIFMERVSFCKKTNEEFPMKEKCEEFEIQEKKV